MSLSGDSAGGRVSKNTIRQLRDELSCVRKTDIEQHSAMGLTPSGGGRVSVQAYTLELLLDRYESTQAGFMDK